MEDQQLGRSALFTGPPAYESRTPWSPWAALLAAVVIIGASILGSILVLGSNLRRPVRGAGGQAART